MRRGGILDSKMAHGSPWLSEPYLKSKIVGNSDKDVSDIRYFPVSGQESGIHLDLVSCIRYKMISGILYPVESQIGYYPVHHQLLPNTAATDLYGIFKISC